jgi:hypothetical protein
MAETSKQRFERYFGAGVCAQRPFYNFGSGRWRHPCFKNMDIVHPKYPNNRPDLVYDAFSKAPFNIDPNSARIFYISQVNEHLTDDINSFVFAQMYAALAPGGLLRIAYPDFDLAARACRDDDRELFLVEWERGPHAAEARRETPIELLFVDFFATRAQAGSPEDGNRKYSADEVRALIDTAGFEATADKICAGLSIEVQKSAPGCHMNWWNHAKMERFLRTAGFSQVQRSAHRQSACPPLRDGAFFDKALPQLSGYIEARK